MGHWPAEWGAGHVVSYALYPAGAWSTSPERAWWGITSEVRLIPFTNEGFRTPWYLLTCVYP